ncbi:VOC family protein [Streptosporangium sp. NPDC051022]|uniref:VOC family protein n=1 Tax=Streptosporangium sp. NPDC051022 TaxID=3155752 RepID=UPI003420B139
MRPTVNGVLKYGMTVPSLEEADVFYRTFGLLPVEGARTLGFACDGAAAEQVELLEARHKRIAYVSFGVDEGRLEEFGRDIEARGVVLRDAPASVEAPGLWFQDPDGLWVNVREARPDPGRSLPTVEMNVGGARPRVDVAAWRHMPERARPNRLGHVLLYVSDLAASERFYAGLGFRLSDRTGRILSFWHARPGDHHTFGFVQSTHPGLHHSSWEVADLDMLMIGRELMDDRGHPGWGLGRHGLGSNIFTYFPDPWGSWIEYFIDIDQISENWEPHDYDAPTTMWGPRMPQGFVVNSESTERTEL